MSKDNTRAQRERLMQARRDRVAAIDRLQRDHSQRELEARRLQSEAGRREAAWRTIIHTITTTD